MEIFPSEYQHLELNRHEKVFVRHACNDEEYGFVILKINPAMISGDYLHAVISSRGVVFYKFLPLDDTKIFSLFIESYYSGIIESTAKTIEQKLSSNKALLESDGSLAIRVAIVCVFPEINREDIKCDGLSSKLKEYITYNCMFAEEFSSLRNCFSESVNKLLEHPAFHHSDHCMTISDLNINSIIHRIAPEYTVVRFAIKNENNSTPGASEELLVIDEDDVAVRAFRLEAEQINIVNRITKGDQLILACAGSGKSVLLIAKCFKAAKMNPEKRFLITCYNRNLQSLYIWFIERAGLTDRNVDCLTFDGLCKKILTSSHLLLPSGEDAIFARRASAMSALRDGKITTRYYGIFIDEVQMFETIWYQMCYNLLENKDGDDHIFVVCGDKTQEIKQRQPHKKEPWKAGEGYPVFRGSNRNLRIEKNFRNCVEINEFINVFVQNARALIQQFNPKEEFDPDMFLRGKSFRHGNGVTIRAIDGNAMEEALLVVDSVKKIHDNEHIPYDEIAITFYNRQYEPYYYYIEAAITEILEQSSIPFTKLYTNDDLWAGHYGDGGVSLITFESVLGLDYQAVVVCGLRPLGAYDKTKRLKNGSILNEEQVENLKKNIRSLYVACTRAKDYLHIILSEASNKSLYNKLLTDSEKQGGVS